MNNKESISKPLAPDSAGLSPTTPSIPSANMAPKEENALGVQRGNYNRKLAGPLRSGTRSGSLLSEERKYTLPVSGKSNSGVVTVALP